MASRNAFLTQLDELKSTIIKLAEKQPSMKHVYHSDLANYVQIEIFIKNGKITKAQKYASNLDSIVKDRLPKSLWDL